VPLAHENWIHVAIIPLQLQILDYSFLDAPDKALGNIIELGITNFQHKSYDGVPGAQSSFKALVMSVHRSTLVV